MIVRVLRLNEQHQQPEGAHFKLKIAAQACEPIRFKELDDILYLNKEGVLDIDEYWNKQIESIVSHHNH